MASNNNTQPDAFALLGQDEYLQHPQTSLDFPDFLQIPDPMEELLLPNSCFPHVDTGEPSPPPTPQPPPQPPTYYLSAAHQPPTHYPSAAHQPPTHPTPTNPPIAANPSQGLLPILPRPVCPTPQRGFTQAATPILPAPIDPTRYESPMSITTPPSIYRTTPQTTPPQPPLTPVTAPVTPLSERIAIFSAVVGNLPDNRVDKHFSDATNRASRRADEQKLLKREQLKREDKDSSSLREAKVHRTKCEAYLNHIKYELRQSIHFYCLLLEFIRRNVQLETPDQRKRPRNN